MNRECRREAAMLAELREHGATENVSRHLLECPNCADTTLVWRHLEELQALDVVVPAAGTVWWRAQLRKRREASLRAERIIHASEAAAWLAGATIGAIGFIGLLPLVFTHVPTEYFLGSAAMVALSAITALVARLLGRAGT
jgi:hypothetical protein